MGYLLDNFDLYLFHSPEVKFKRHFLFISFYAYTKSHEYSDYFIFNDKEKKVLKSEKLFIENRFNNDFSDTKGFEHYMLEKAIDEVKALFEAKMPEIKEIYMDKVDLSNYNIFLSTYCKDILNEISKKTLSDKLRNQLSVILNLKYNIGKVEE